MLASSSRATFVLRIIYGAAANGAKGCVCINYTNRADDAGTRGIGARGLARVDILLFLIFIIIFVIILLTALF